MRPPRHHDSVPDQHPCRSLNRSKAEPRQAKLHSEVPIKVNSQLEASSTVYQRRSRTSEKTPPFLGTTLLIGWCVVVYINYFQRFETVARLLAWIRVALGWS